ncbi:MAG: hypothetical protein J6031_00935 [Bacteroidales bacterium]|nr:hypothetical protein [Bacteroidales bacterium]
MKKILTFVAAIAITSMVSAQFYGNVATGRGGQISIYGGIASTSASPQIKYNTPYTDYWGITYVWADINADKVTPILSPAFLLTLQSLKDQSEKFKIGGGLGVGFTQCQWQAQLSAATSGIPNDYTLWSKSNLIDVQMGIEGSYLLSEQFSIDFAIGPDILFAAGNQVRSEKSVAGTLIPDDNANNWKKAEKCESISAPSIDVGAYARIGANYHFTETMWAGLTFQYHMPFFNFATLVQDEYSKDAFLIADDNLIYTDIKHHGWALMLTLGINFE